MYEQAALTDDQVMAEPGVWTRDGLIFYLHQSGKVFVTTTEKLSGNGVHSYAVIGAVPPGAVPFLPLAESPAEDRVDEWTDFCDDGHRGQGVQ